MLKNIKISFAIILFINTNIASEDYTTFIVINDVKRMVFSLNMNDKTLTLYNYAKLKKK